MTTFARTLKRLLAVGLSSALIALSAGPEAYAAVGRAVEVNGGAHAVPAALPSAPVNLQIPSVGAANGALPGASLSLPSLPNSAAAVPNGAASVPGLAPSAAVPGARLGAAEASAPGASAGKAVAAESAVTPQQQAAAQNESAATGGASALDSAAAGLETAQPGAVAKTGRVASVIRSLKSVFGAKSVQAVPGAPAAPVSASINGVESSAPAINPQALLKSSASQAPPSAEGSSAAKTQAEDGKGQPPAPPSDNNGGNNDDGSGGGRSWFGLGKAAAAFIGALLVMQVGVEALGASMPTLVQKAFGDFTVVAQLGIFSSVASITGRQIGPILVKKYGLKKVYLTAEILRLISISALCALLATGTMTLPLMMGMYCINGMLGGVALTAESSIPPALIGNDQKKLERFWTVEQTLLETIGVTGPIVTGMVVASMGFLPALIAYPISFAIAIAIMLKTLRIPQKVEAMRIADLAKAQAEGKTSIGNAFKEFFRKVGHGAKLVWKNPALKYPFLGYTAYMALNPFLYSMLAPAYALRLVGSPEHATSVSGWLTGLYSLGGLLGGLVMMWESKKLEKSKPTAEQEEQQLRKSMLTWMKWGTLGLLAIGTLAFPSPMFLGTLTLPALALIPFGIAQVITTIKLKSYFQAKAPQGEMADAMGFFGAASLAVSTSGLLVLKYVFKHAAGFTPFWYIALAMIPLAGVYVFLTRKMAKVSEPAKK
jgi:MFS family permease